MPVVNDQQSEKPGVPALRVAPAASLLMVISADNDVFVNVRDKMNDNWLQKVAEDAEKRIMTSDPLHDNPARAILRKLITADSDKIWRQLDDTINVLPD